MKTRSLALTCMLALLLAAGAGCGGSDEPSGGELSGTVSFMAFGEPEELKAFRGVIAAYEDVQPAVEVQLIEASDRQDLLARLSTSFSGGSPPDLFLINYRFYGQFAAKGVLEPIGSRFAASEAFDEEDFYDQALDAFRFGGELTCLPQNISSLVVYYNKDLFEQANVEVPRAGWTWRDMTTRAVALTKDLDGDGKVDQYGLGVEPSLIRLAPFVWSNGGELVKPDLSGFALDDDAAQEVIDEFFSLRTDYKAIPSDEELEAEDDETRFMNGRSAMVLSSRRATPSFRTITKFDWDVVPLPVFKQRAGILHSDAYCMTTASKNKDAAWDFMEFALGPEGQRITARSGRTVPSLKAVANSEAFLDPNAKPASSKVFLDGIPSIRQVPSLSTWPEIEDAAEGILEKALYEGARADEVVAELRAATDAIFARGEH
ncbi:MAG: sugar ABC transporter substrate-binding protein [Gaiellaceae bacterium]